MYTETVACDSNIVDVCGLNTIILSIYPSTIHGFAYLGFSFHAWSVCKVMVSGKQVSPHRALESLVVACSVRPTSIPRTYR